MRITSPAFQHNQSIPTKYACDGDDVNPPLNIVETPPETKSVVLIVDDPDAPVGTFTHWVIWNIAAAGEIAKNSAPGVEGVNDFGRTGYGGPCPPSGTHRYFFRAFALDTKLDLEPGSEREDVELQMEGHIIANAELVGTYGR
ncbi:MAG: YbhB/YbcL family Raf kinase inhibitor-like protein [Nanobdellota archaeon]